MGDETEFEKEAREHRDDVIATRRAVLFAMRGAAEGFDHKMLAASAEALAALVAMNAPTGGQLSPMVGMQMQTQCPRCVRNTTTSEFRNGIHTRLATECAWCGHSFGR